MKRTGACSDERPWPGLFSYTEADAGYFFGRTQELALVSSSILANRTTVIFGPSGTGKTSLLHAGVFTGLRKKALFPITIRPLEFNRCAITLCAYIKRRLRADCIEEGIELDEGRLPPLTSEADESLWEYLQRIEMWGASFELVEPVLVFDQFEEWMRLFAIDAPATHELADVIENYVPHAIESLPPSTVWGQVIASRNHPWRVVLCLREDCIGQMEDLSRRVPSVMRNRIPLRRMTRQQGREVILGPGADIICKEMADRLLDFAVTGGPANSESSSQPMRDNHPVEPAILSLICRELNERRITEGTPQITVPDMEEAGGQILRNFYKQCFSPFRSTTARCFVEDCLIDPSITPGRTFATDAQATNAGVRPDEIEHLIEQRLLRRETRQSGTHLELSHDVLIQPVQESRDSRLEQIVREKAKQTARELEEQKQQRREAERLTREARSAREETEELVVFMIGEIAEKLDAREHLALLSPLVDRLIAHFDAMQHDGASPNMLRNAARAYQCAANVRKRQGRFQDVADAYDHAAGCMHRFRKEWITADRVLTGICIHEQAEIMIRELGNEQIGLQLHRRAVDVMTPEPTDTLPVVDAYRHVLTRCVEVLRSAGHPDEAIALQETGRQKLSNRHTGSDTEILSSGIFDSIDSSQSTSSPSISSRVGAWSSMTTSGPSLVLDNLVRSALSMEEDIDMAEPDSNEPWSQMMEDLYRNQLDFRSKEAESHPGDVWRACAHAEALLLLGDLLTRKPGGAPTDAEEMLILSQHIFQAVETGNRNIPSRYRPVRDRAQYRCAGLLIAASESDNVETCKALLAHGAEIDARNENGKTALWVAAANGRSDFCSLLLERGANIDVLDTNGYTPLMGACHNSERDQSNTVALLLEKGADVETAGKDGWRTLMLAAQHGHVETGKILLEHGAEIDARKENGGTALWVAAANGRSDFCSLLLESGASINVLDTNGYSPLMRACHNSERDQSDTVALLLERGAAVEVAEKDGWRPLMLAAQHGHVETGKVLLEHGAEIDARNEDGGTALWVAAYNGSADYCRLMLEHGANINVLNTDGYTPLMQACNNSRHDHSDTVTLLIENGAAVETAGNNGFRPLMLAAVHGHIETGKVLLTHGAEIDARKEGGGTALWVAAANGCTDYCRLMLEHGANIDILDTDGYTPLMRACNKSERDQSDTVALLLEKGAAVETASKNGWRPLIIAAEHGHVETGKVLLTHGAEIDARKEDGGTALLVAAANCRSEFCHLLLENGADKRAISIRGDTPATYASVSGNCPDILPCLFDVETFSIESVRKKAGTNPETAQMVIEALVCASDMAVRNEDYPTACRHLELALTEIDVNPSSSKATILRRLVIERLMKASFAMKNYPAAVKYQRDYVDLLRDRVKVQNLPTADLSGDLGQLCWDLLLVGAHSDAQSIGEEAIQLLSNEKPCPARLNLAHAYLVNGQFEKAKAIYSKYLGQRLEDGRSWDNEMLNDFKLLRDAGQDHPGMKKIEAMLEKREASLQ